MMRFVAVLCALPMVVGAQADTSRATIDSLLHRAEQLAQSGKDGDSRKLIDSVLKSTPMDAALYSEALYWRASRSATAADAERDYRRLLVEAPLSARAEDAMLQLAQLLQARGDRRGASDYLQRFLLTYADSPARPRVALSLVRLLFDMGPQNEARACEAYRVGREAIPAENLELRNQLEFYAPRCAFALATPPAATPAESTATASPATADTSKAPPTPPADAAPERYYSVQVAAYDSVEPAQRMAQLLVSRGLEARVDGTTRPFRVRVGKYKTRADAAKAAAALKAQGQDAFVTLVSGK